MPLKFKKAEAGKVHEARQNMTKRAAGGDAIVKGATSQRSWNSATRSARFIMTTEQPDRYQDIVGQAGMDLTNFEANPQGLLFHNSRSWPIGTWSDVTKVLSGRPKRIEGNLNFLAEGVDDDADRAARHVEAGSIKTVSIGFIPDWDQVDYILNENDDWTGGFRFNASELIECSLVPVPANPGALMKDAGGDMALARNLIEDVLDTYTKTPEGLLIPLKDYEEKYFELGAAKTMVIVDKAFKSAPKFASTDELEIKSDDQDVPALVGMSVTVKPDHPANKDAVFSLLAEKRSVGEVIASWIAPEHGENKDVHVLAVEFLTDDFTGMLRGFTADRFLLAKAADSGSEDEGQEAEDEGDEAKDQAEATEGDQEAKDADVIKAGQIDASKINAGTVTATKSSPISVSVGVDTSEAMKSIDELEKHATGVMERIGSMFTGIKKWLADSDEPKAEQRVEPPLEEVRELTPEEIAEAKALALATLKEIA